MVHTATHNFYKQSVANLHFFLVIQQELKDTKDNQNSYRIRKSLQPTNEDRPAGRPDIRYFIKENSNEYLHDFCLINHTHMEELVLY